MANTKITSDNLDTLTTLTVDDITLDGSTISDSGNLTVDVGGDIILDAGGDDITFKSGGTEFGSIFKSSNDLFLNSAISDGDIKFRGNDGGSFITALTLDMSNAGRATFNSDVNIGGIDRFNLSGSTVELTIGTTGDTANDGGGISFVHNSSSLNSYLLGQKQSFSIATYSSTPILFLTNNTERMRIDSSGRVGIGVTNPSDYYATDLVVSSAAEKGITIAATATDIANYLMFADGTSGDARYRGYIAYNHSSDQMAFASAGTERAFIDSGGRFTFGGNFAHSTYAHTAVFGANSVPLGTVVIEDFDVSSGIGNTVLNLFLRDQDPATNAIFIDFLMVVVEWVQSPIMMMVVE